MSTGTIEQTLQHIDVRKESQIAAPIEIAWEAMLEALGPAATMPDHKAYPLKLEAWPGGRYFRDLGNNAGHFWGHVQVIKPPTLLEIVGPMFMSYAVASHVQWRLAAEGGGSTKLTLVHKAFGMLDPMHREGVNTGWNHWVNRIREQAEKRKK